MATIAYGEPRLTNHIDVVAALWPEHIDEFCRSFPAPDFYCSSGAMREAIERCMQFKILHPASGLKVDAIIPEDSEFNRSRLQQGQRLAAEDLWHQVLAKACPPAPDVEDTP